VLNGLNPHEIIVDIQKVEGQAAELDELWSDVQGKAHPRWLWQAIDHTTGNILAYTFGDHKDDVFLKLRELLEPFEITGFYTDDWRAYERHLPPEQYTVGKANTQKIERKYLTLRMRIKR
jgi:insertion element IS1 protein InsB